MYRLSIQNNVCLLGRLCIDIRTQIKLINQKQIAQIKLFPHQDRDNPLYIYIYIYVYIDTCIYIYILSKPYIFILYIICNILQYYAV